MKTLLLIRHAEAGWDDFGQADVARDLTTRGKQQAEFLAIEMCKNEIHPELILSSSARRAVQTTERLCAGHVCDIKHVNWRDELYLASDELLLSVAKNVNDQFDCVAIVAHNPGLSDLLNALVSGSHPGMVPSAMVAISWPVGSWSELRKVEGKLELALNM
ncbi:MAG: histidine phosphatase family protein [Mariprofundaceae bacterium]